jgi:hypothetical protein
MFLNRFVITSHKFINSIDNLDKHGKSLNK